MSEFGSSGGALSLSGYNEVSSSRAFGTEYQNTTGNPIYVKISIGNLTDGVDMAGIILRVGETEAQPILEKNRQDTTDSTVGKFANISVSVIVPDGYYYKVGALGQDPADLSLDYWNETELVIE